MKPAGILLALTAGLCMLLQGGTTALAQQKSGIRNVVAHGRMLVTFAGCNDCHSPKVFTAMGPVPDTTRLLSGHPADSKLPEIPSGVLGPDKWGALTTGDLTAWVGPWGVSFSANLTPDQNTGLGKWTDAMFIKALRTGKHMGEGRQILPPMPWEGFGKMSDGDLKAIFAYLRTLKPVQNAVPDPLPPSGGGQPH
jgi:mono/diheme cytochrome c family protein